MKKGKENIDSKVVIFQSKSGAIELRSDVKKDTIWASQADMAKIFAVNSQAVTKHLINIYKEEELDKKTTCSKMEQVRFEGKRKVRRNIEIYNLDAIISVGYRISSKAGTNFRKWATKVLGDHITKGYTINKSIVEGNYSEFKKAIENVKVLLPSNKKINNKDIVELISVYADTWLSLEAYDKDNLINKGSVKKKIGIEINDLLEALSNLKLSLVEKNEATDIFGKERNKDSIAGIVGNVLQSFGGKELYGTVEEKAAHLLYFIIKNHPFVDGNKRSGAFSFIWFLRKANLLRAGLSPEALTALTLLIAESNPRDKDKMIKLVLQMLKKKIRKLN